MIFAMIGSAKPDSIAADQAPKNNSPRRARVLRRGTSHARQSFNPRIWRVDAKIRPAGQDVFLLRGGPNRIAKSQGIARDRGGLERDGRR